MQMTRRFSWVLIMGLVGVPAWLAGPAHAQQVEFRETTSVVVVEVPVQVTSDGEPVRGLGRENFQLFDDGRKQEILGVEMIDLSEMEPAALPSAARRHFLVLFDFSLSDPESILRGQRATRDLLASLHPADVVGVATYSAANGVKLVLGFTSDRRQAELAIATLGFPELIERTRDPVNVYLGEPPAEPDAEAEKTLLEALRRMDAAEKVYNPQDRVISMCRNLGAMAYLMAGIEGQKHVIYLSNGFDSNLLTGYDSQLSKWTLRKIWTTNLERKFGDTRLRNDLEELTRAFRRAGGMIHSVNIGSLQLGPTERGLNTIEAGLFSIARDTGGQFFRSFGHLGPGIGEVLKKSAVTYVVAFQPQHVEFDGRYHPLKIKLKNAPKGTTATYRAGYYAPTPFAEVGPHERRFAAAELLLGDEGGSIGVEVLAAPVPVANERSYVPLLIEVDGASVLRDRAGDFAQMELYTYAVDPGGRVFDFAAKNVGLDLKEVTPLLERGGFKFMGHLDLPPGDFTLRVLARNSHTGRYSLRCVPITVPAFDDDEALLLPPMFPDLQGKWLLSREDEATQRDVPYPFTIGDGPYVPAARPIVPAQGSIPVYLQGYNLYLEEYDFELVGRVSDAAGAPVADVVLEAEEIVVSGLEADYDSFAIRARLDTPGIEPGEYTLEVEVTDAYGDPWSSSNRFVVEASEPGA